MSDSHGRSRRSYLKLVGATSAVGVTGLAGCTGDQGESDDTTTESGGDETEETTEETTEATTEEQMEEGPVPFGSLLPITGALSDYGSGMQAAVELAEQHINDGGGPLGREVSVTYKDSGTKPEVGQQKYNELVNENDIRGFVGAASSGVSTPIAETVASDGVMQISNASTSPALAEIGFDDDGVKYFGRTAPNDSQQGIVMGMIMDDFIEAESAAFLHVDNPYGEGLAEKASEAFEGETVGTVGYAQETNDYTSTLDSLFENDPDAIGFVGYPGNGRTILQQWQSGGYGGEWVLSEGLNSPEFFQEMGSVTAGMYVASPAPESTDGADIFNEELGSSPTLFAPHAYDGLFLMALAMHKGGEATGTAIAQNLQSVSAPDGEVVTVGEFEKAKGILDDGGQINYEGASSPVDMNEALEPLNRFAVLQVTDEATTEELAAIEREEFM